MRGMTLTQFLQALGIKDYYILWYGENGGAALFDAAHSLVTPTASLYGKSFDDGGTCREKLFLCFRGVTPFKCVYECAVRIEKVNRFADGKAECEFKNAACPLDDFAGRLLVERASGQHFLNASGDSFRIAEIYPDERHRKLPPFVSYDKTELTYPQLQELAANEYQDWKHPLSRINAIYMIVDSKTGKQYIGSTYTADGGLYARWKHYANTFHADDAELIRIKEQNDQAYLDGFKWFILKVLPLQISETEALEEETFFKERFCTRISGLNRN